MSKASYAEANGTEKLALNFWLKSSCSISGRQINVFEEKLSNREKGFYNQEEEFPSFSLLKVFSNPMIKFLFVVVNITPALEYGSGGTQFKAN